MVFNDLDVDTLNLMMVFQYMIGNTDFSIYALHNIVLVQKPDRTLYALPFDFDISGLVRPPYAIPARGLMITSVVDRLYRGPCRTLEQIEPSLATFIAKQDPVTAVVDSLPDLKKENHKEVKDYLDDFFSSIKNRKDVRRLFVEGCKKADGM